MQRNGEAYIFFRLKLFSFIHANTKPYVKMELNRVAFPDILLSFFITFVSTAGSVNDWSVLGIEVFKDMTWPGSLYFTEVGDPSNSSWYTIGNSCP